MRYFPTTGKIFIAAFFVVLALSASAGHAQAATYYVDANLSADCTAGNYSIANRACNGSNGNAYNTITDVNSRLAAGDTAIIRAGTYAQQIAPSQNGRSGSPITFVAHTGETVNITPAATRQADLETDQYITIDGLNFRNAPGVWIYAQGSVGVIIKNCTFVNALGYQGISLAGASYAKVQNNTFSSGECSYPGNTVDYCPGDFVSFYASPNNAHHIVVEGNTFGRVMHYPVNGGGTYNVIRNNLIQNTWHAQIGLHFMQSAAPNLIEGNILRDAGMEKASCPSEEIRNEAARDQRSIQLNDDSFNAIIRKNIVYNNGTFAIAGYQYRVSRDHRIYNNTFDEDYRSIYVLPSTNQGYVGGIVLKNNAISNAKEDYNIYWTINNENTNTFINNNLYGANSRYRGTTGSASALNSAYPSEWSGNTAVDPLFTNRSLRDYSLTSSSPLINAGTWLTTITSATQGGAGATSFVVADAGYFYDGWGIPGEVGDVIKLANGQKSTITAINYSTNQITVNSSVSWSQGMGVALDYEGTKPDIGAKEYGGGSDTRSPSVPSGLSVR